MAAPGEHLSYEYLVSTCYISSSSILSREKKLLFSAFKNITQINNEAVELPQIQLCCFNKLEK